MLDMIDNMKMWVQLMSKDPWFAQKPSKRSEGRAVVCHKCGCGGTLYKSGRVYICRKCREKEEKRK